MGDNDHEGGRAAPGRQHRKRQGPQPGRKYDSGTSAMSVVRMKRVKGVGRYAGTRQPGRGNEHVKAE